MSQLSEEELGLRRESIALERERNQWARIEATRSAKVAWLNLVASMSIGVAASIVSISQLWLAINDDARKKTDQEFKTVEMGWKSRGERIKENQEQRAAKEMDIKMRESTIKVSSEWYKYVNDHESRVYSENPVDRCRMRTFLKGFNGEEFFDRNYGALNIPSDFCDQPKMLDAVVQNKFDGAEIGWTRRDPTSKVLLSAQCTMRTENRHGRPDIVVERVCALSSSVSPKARIYNVSYSCPEYACLWSYNPDGGYSARIKQSDDKRSFTTWRRWDGDPVTETYTFFYEQPIS